MIVTLLIMIAVVTSMIAINALYVAGEFASVSARKTRIVQEAEQGNRLAKLLLPVIEDHHKLDNYIAASQVGITLSSIVLGIYGQQQIAPLLTPVLQNLPIIDSEVAAAGLSSLLVLIVLTGLQVVLGELVPKSLALLYPEGVALWTVLPMRWSAEYILRPLIILLNGSGAVLLRLVGAQHEAGHKHVHSPEEIQLLIRQSHEGGLLDAEERQMMDNAFHVSELTVGDVLIPRTRMMAAEVGTPLVELLRLSAIEYSRIPLYEEDIDHIIGFVHIKDLFRLYHKNKHGNPRTVLHKACFVPETASLNDVWRTMNTEKSYMAIVFDEYGGTVGMVTREDLIEEIFGEVRDEFDEDEIALVTPLENGDYLVRGDAAILNLNSQLDLDLPAENAHTISGLVLDESGHIPVVGDVVEVANIKITVQSVRNNMVETLLLHIPQSASDQTDEDETR